MYNADKDYNNLKTTKWILICYTLMNDNNKKPKTVSRYIVLGLWEASYLTTQNLK